VAGPLTATTTVTGGVLLVALIAGLAFTGFSSLAQAAAIRSLERTYRRQKSQELELALGRELTAHLEQLRTHLAGGEDAWRGVVRQLLVDAGIGDAAMLEAGGVSIEPVPCLVVEGGSRRYLFTTAPDELRRNDAVRRSDRVILLDAALSPFARIEAQALWDHLAAQRWHGGQTTLPRDATWYLVVHEVSTRRPHKRRMWWRRRTKWRRRAPAPTN
jgi:hypothetical protein